MYKKYVYFLLIVIVAAVLIWSSTWAQEVFYKALIIVEDFINLHPLLGILIFIGLTVLSAMFAFFTSIALVPIAVFAWGQGFSFILLWMSWLLGGVISYFIGRGLGRKVVGYFVQLEKIDYYEQRLSTKIGFFMIFLFRLVTPAEIPGYLLGIIRYNFAKYLLITLLAELPFALGAVYVSEAFLRQERFMFLGILLGGFIIISIIFHIFHKKFIRH
ncbi:MAG: VTT domain-containing protein [Candidatus Paceibacterota bacterium]